VALRRSGSPPREMIFNIDHWRLDFEFLRFGFGGC
jgi:hypothetical protein